MELLVGKINHFYSKINVAVIDLTGDLQIGDTVHILGNTTDFSQIVTSMQIEHKAVDQVTAGEEVALKVIEPVRDGDDVFIVKTNQAASS